MSFLICFRRGAINLEIYQLLLIAVISLAASYVQSVTGFGFGIVAMIFLPSLLMYTEANVLSSILSSVTSVLVVIAMYRKIDWKNLAFPLIGSFFANYIAITFMKNAKNEILILLLGVALLVLSAYFFFYSDKIKIRPTWYAGFIAGSISGVMSGLFAIGGPRVVVYYMQSEKDTNNYLATISAYFVFSGIISITMKAMSSFVTLNVWVSLVIGFAGMFAGYFLGKCTRSKINAQMVKKAVYGVMAASGLIHIVTAVI